jgi:hypothetical protein
MSSTSTIRGRNNQPLNLINVRIDNSAHQSDVFHDTLVNFPTSSDYYLFANASDIQGDDATVSYNVSDGCLDVDSSVFTKLWTLDIDPQGGLDHVKYLTYRNGAITLPGSDVELVVETEMAGVQYLGTIPAALQPGITNPNADLRIACGALNTIDYASWMVYDCMVTNEEYYAFYERLPFGRSDFGGSMNTYHAFSHCIPIGKRDKSDPANDFANIKICVNKEKDYVRWVINGQEKLRINRLGMPIDREYRILDHGGESEVVDQSHINVGFGTFTLLDMANPVKGPSLVRAMQLAGSDTPLQPLLQLGLSDQYIDPISVDPVSGSDIPATFLSNDSDNRLFNNGALLRLKYLKAYTQYAQFTDQ